MTNLDSGYSFYVQGAVIPNNTYQQFLAEIKHCNWIRTVHSVCFIQNKESCLQEPTDNKTTFRDVGLTKVNMCCFIVDTCMICMLRTKFTLFSKIKN